MSNYRPVVASSRVLVLAVVVVGAVLLRTVAAGAQRTGMSCTILSAVGPAFGAYDSMQATPTDSAGYVSFRCEGVTNAGNLAIEIGRGLRNTIDRAMGQRGARLEYNLYLDAARTQIWGDGSRGTSRYYVRPPEGLTVTVPIYGRIPPRQRVAVGAYSDRLQLIMQY